MKRIITLCAVLLTLGAFSAVYAESDAGVKGAEAGAAKFYIYADQGDDTADKAYIEMQADGEFAFNVGGVEVGKFGDSNGNFSVIGTLTPAGASVLSSVTVSGSFEPDMVVIADTNAYTVLDNNSGQVHFVPDTTADSTFTLPAESANLHYKFVYAGGAADAQDWIITTGNDTNYFVGGLVQFDPGATTTTSVVNYYSDGNSNSKIGVLTPESGTEVEIWCEDGTTWYVSGTVVSDTDAGVTFADQ